MGSYETENVKLVEKVYHYLKAEGITVFFAPAPECKAILSGKNQREIFYEIFGLNSEFAALFISKTYVSKEVPMEEASIAIAKHTGNGSVIPVYLDEAQLPPELFDPKNTNYFKSNNPAQIASHLASKIKNQIDKRTDNFLGNNTGNMMNIKKFKDSCKEGRVLEAWGVQIFTDPALIERRVSLAYKITK